MAKREEHLTIKRIYEPIAPHDGMRVLVDRLWARGVSKDAANLVAWMKELGPTDELRAWFGHQPTRWDAFVERYRRELTSPLRQLLLAELQGIAAESLVTLVYGARDTQENEAVVLRDYLLQETAQPGNVWDATTMLLLTVAVVAAAHADAVAPTPDVRRLASAILSAHEFEDARKGLLTSGDLRESAGGWELTPHAQQQARRLALADRI